MIKITNKLLAFCLLVATTTTMTSASSTNPVPTGILRESTFNNRAHRNTNNNKLVVFNRTVTEHQYIPNGDYLQSLQEGYKEIKANMSKNACEHLVVRYIQQDFYKENTEIDTLEFTEQEKRVALAMHTAEEEIRNKRRIAKVQVIAQNNNFYDHAATHLLRASLIVGGLYLVSSYFQKKK